MKIGDVKKIVEEQITIAYRLAYENAAKVAIGVRDGWALHNDPAYNAADDIATEILKLPIPTVTVVRPETAALHPEKVTSHTIIAGQGLHPVTDEIIDREKLERLGTNIGITSNGTVLRWQ